MFFMCNVMDDTLMYIEAADQGLNISSTDSISFISNERCKIIIKGFASLLSLAYISNGSTLV